MNDAMRRLEGLVGEWQVTMTHAWFLESMDTEIHGSATFEWLADAFLVMRSTWEDGSTQEFVFGRSDARDAFVAFSHDDRGVYRVFDMTFADGEWTLLARTRTSTNASSFASIPTGSTCAPTPRRIPARPGERTSTTSSSADDSRGRREAV
jgi:hypothetical protein